MQTNLRNAGEGTAYLVAREEHRAEFRISLFRIGFIGTLFMANLIPQINSPASSPINIPELLPLAILLLLALGLLTDIWWIGRGGQFSRFYKPAYKYFVIMIDVVAFSFVLYLAFSNELIREEIILRGLTPRLLLPLFFLGLFGIYIILDLLRFSVASLYFTFAMFSTGYSLVYLLIFRNSMEWSSALTYTSFFTVPAFLMTLLCAYVSKRMANMVLDSKIQQQLERYLPPALAKEHWKKNSPLTNLGEGRLSETAVLFADIRGFTAISGRLNPVEMVELLNTYFNDMIDEIFKHRGTIDKIAGDKLIALFGTPVCNKDHCEQALSAALGMMDRLSDLNKMRNLQGEETIELGIGIDHGEVVLGSVGSSQRMDFTAIGDPVNTASRLETLTKKFKSDIIISNNLLERVSPEFQRRLKLEEYGKAQLKGKRKPITVSGVERKKYAM